MSRCPQCRDTGRLPSGLVCSYCDAAMGADIEPSDFERAIVSLPRSREELRAARRLRGARAKHETSGQPEPKRAPPVRVTPVVIDLEGTLAFACEPRRLRGARAGEITCSSEPAPEPGRPPRYAGPRFRGLGVTHKRVHESAAGEPVVKMGTNSQQVTTPSSRMVTADT